MNFGNFVKITVMAVLSAMICGPAQADTAGYARSENTGRVNFNPTGGGVTVYDDRLEGYIWHENIGWISLKGTSYGVSNDGSGTLSGCGWSENAGWVNFSPGGGGVTITGGLFDGYAWAENAGWIHFRNTAYNVVTTWGGGTPPPPAGLPAAPSGLTAEPVSHEAIYLTWTDNSSNETGFIIERWSLVADWTTVAVVGANTASYTDSPLSYSWEYHYRIRAYNAGGNSDFSNETYAITWFHPYNTCKGITLNGSSAVRGSASVQENSPAGTVIGTFGTVEPACGLHNLRVALRVPERPKKGPEPARH